MLLILLPVDCVLIIFMVIATFYDLQIDCSALLEMNDESMKDYIPAYGDRLAAKAFCRVKENKNQKHSSLIEKIKSKLSRKRKCDDIPSNKNAEKQDRRVELGWQDYDEGTKEYKQIRSHAERWRDTPAESAKNTRSQGNVGHSQATVFPAREVK